MAIASSNPAASGKWYRVLRCALLLVAAAFLCLHLLHLTADFPNYSPWMDWAKYTDEGWYGDAAIRHYLLGHWYVRGGFNPAAALPVWPVLELAVFHFAGVSLAAARALTVGVFGLILVSSFFLLRRWQDAPRSLVPATAVLLLAVSPFCYVFTRMAILEPLLILLTLLALLVVSAAPTSFTNESRIIRSLPVVGLGILLPLMILTKTTAIFLFPAVAWLLWAAVGYRIRPFLRVGLPSIAIAGGLWVSYFVFFVRPHFLADYRYLFSANGYTGITAATAFSVLRDTLKDGLWMGKVLYPVALIAVVVAVALLRRRTNPLLVALALWTGGYAAFLAYHNNLQPRYYLVLAVPLTLLLPLAFEELAVKVLLPRYGASPSLRIFMTLAAGVVFAAVALPDARQTIHYVRKPEYTFERAAAQVRGIVVANPTQSKLILSISGADLSLMTGLPSICDDFGTMELAQRVATYRPGWYAAWNQVEDDKMEALAPLYKLSRVAEFPAMDDPERNLLILYRLDPADAPPPARGKRKPIPRRLQTKIGQQPSVQQLEH
ncbi:MAG: hypothetical protein ABI197_04730 [Granulicella sp.]